MKYTGQQQAIIQGEEGDLKVHAFAGTGKTTTLEGYARARPNERFLYIAFNKSVQQEASQRFPQNVLCRTSHALAFPRFGSKYAAKLVPNVRALEAAEAINLPRNEVGIAHAAIAALTGWFSSANTSIADYVYAVAQSTTKPEYLAKVIGAANLLWQRMSDPTDKQVGMLHDGYLKMWALSNPQLPCDICLADEFQDTTPLIADIIFRQKSASVIAVGDPHQSIYAFRGACDALSRMDAPTAYLSESFRFGPNIANIANEILALKGETVPLVGRGVHTDIGFIRSSSKHTVLCRTNAGVFDAAAAAVDDGLAIQFVGGMKGYNLDRILDAYRLFADDREAVRDKYLRRFSRFSELEEHVKEGNDVDLAGMVRTVREFEHRIPELIVQMDKRATDRNAQVTICTAHKSKGLEWDNVRLYDDFIDPSTYLKQREEAFASGDSVAKVDNEIGLAYVAVTRAKKRLHPYSTLLDFMTECGLPVPQKRTATA